MDTLHRIAADLGARFNDATRLAGTLISRFPPPAPPPPLFASITGPPRAATDAVAKTLTGTSVYTVSNSDNEFVLVSDPAGEGRSISLVCFRREDAEAILAQVMARRKELKIQGKVVPMTLDQRSCCIGCVGLDCCEFDCCECGLDVLVGRRRVAILEPGMVYSLKVEGIAFRFLPDPIQIKNALELKASDRSGGFDGVPVFQSDLLVVKRKKKRYSPIYFRKEDLEKELRSRMRGATVSQHIVVGSLEDVLRKMEIPSTHLWFHGFSWHITILFLDCFDFDARFVADKCRKFRVG
ncbi:TIC 22, chloroplastic-like protein [Drosera capensis]